MPSTYTAYGWPHLSVVYQFGTQTKNGLHAQIIPNLLKKKKGNFTDSLIHSAHSSVFMLLCMVFSPK